MPASRAMDDRGVMTDDEDAGPEVELDERMRQQYLVVLQFLQARGLLESYAALESETRVRYKDGALPQASVLETSLDLFAEYRTGGAGAQDAAAAAAVAADEAELLRLERGACCTGPLAAGAGALEPLGTNVTAVCWASASCDEFVALAATADRRLRLLGADGAVLTELAAGLPSPVLGLDAAPRAPGRQAPGRAPAAAAPPAGPAGPADAEEAQLFLATSMGGEVALLRLRWLAQAAEGAEAAPVPWRLEVAQSFRDHAKHATSGRFAPLPLPLGEDAAANSSTRHFATVSRDHKAHLYARRPPASGEDSGEAPFELAGSVALAGEVTCCCWASDLTFVLAARDDHRLHYWDAQSGPKGQPAERLKANLNALGDSVVSFTVLALAASPDRRLLAACTDKSRVIVLRAMSSRQLRNLYGAFIDEYDVPSVCFSLDGTFVYCTSSLPHRAPPRAGEEEAAAAADFCGQIAVFELRTGEMVLQLPCHQRAVRCLHRHPEAEALVTGSFDKTVRFWG